jgi:hypothetical protein
VAREGEANFQGLQRFLKCVNTLSAERRLSRYAYLAEKPAESPLVVPCCRTVMRGDDAACERGCD